MAIENKHDDRHMFGAIIGLIIAVYGVGLGIFNLLNKDYTSIPTYCLVPLGVMVGGIIMTKVMLDNIDKGK